MAGNAMMAADSSIGRTCSLSASDTSNGSRRCADAKPASEPVVDHVASVSATSIGRPPGSVRTCSCSIGPRRRTTSAYGPSMLCCVSDATAMRECHESVQSGPPAESSWPSKGTNESAVTLSCAGSAPVASSAANVSTRCMEACLACRRPVQSAVGHGPRFERGERGRRQAVSEVDRKAAVLDPAEPAEEEDDDVER